LQADATWLHVSLIVDNGCEKRTIGLARPPNAAESARVDVDGPLTALGG